MVTFLLFILAGIGITNLVVNATILDNLRDFVIQRSNFFGKLLTCMMCSGFWVGLLLGPVFSINMIVAGATISLLSFVFSYFIEYAELLIAIKAKELDDLIVEDESVE